MKKEKPQSTGIPLIDTLKDKHYLLSGYQLTKDWFDFIFDSSEIITPLHTSLFLWIVELNNRLQWKNVIGLPTDFAMQASCIKSYKSYKNTLDDLIKWGFVILVSKSYNQYSCNQIALVLNTKAIPKQMQSRYQSDTKAIPKQMHHSKTVKTIKNNTKEESDAFCTDYHPLNIFSDLAFKLWKQIYDDLKGKRIEPTNLLKAKPDTWTNQMRLMIETDKRTEAEILEILNFLKTDEFWRNNIQSPEKLRKQFERLQAESRKLKRKPGKTVFTPDLSTMNYNLKP